MGLHLFLVPLKHCCFGTENAHILFIYLFSSVCIYFVFSLMLAHEFATPNYHLRISNTASRIITSVTRWRGGWRGCPWLCNIDIFRTHFLTYRPFLAEKKYPAPPPPPFLPPPAHLALIYSLGPSSRNKYIIINWTLWIIYKCQYSKRAEYFLRLRSGKRAKTPNSKKLFCIVSPFRQFEFYERETYLFKKLSFSIYESHQYCGSWSERSV